MVTDGSNLYPAVIAEFWSEADHQVARLPRHQGHQQADAGCRAANAESHEQARQGRAEEEAGPQEPQVQGSSSPPRDDGQGESVLRIQASVFIVKCQEDFTEQERDDLRRMLEYLPELATLRRFADRMYWLFDTPKDFHQASCRRAAIVRDTAFQAVPELVKAIEQLDEEKFPKLMAYLNNPISQRVRTNNHVERTNRMFRLLEKVRYKWRRRKTLVRFVVLHSTTSGATGNPQWHEGPIAQNPSNTARGENP